MKNMKTGLPGICCVLSLAAVIFLAVPGNGYGAEGIDVPTITPLYENSPEAYRPPLESEYIEGERRGFVERIGEGFLVISDTTKRLAQNVRFYRGAKGAPISLSEIQVGTYVGYTVNERAEIEVMWIAE